MSKVCNLIDHIHSLASDFFFRVLPTIMGYLAHVCSVGNTVSFDLFDHETVSKINVVFGWGVMWKE